MHRTTETKSLDTNELELPETTFVRDIENKVFQSIVAKSLSSIEGIALTSGSFIDHILGRSSADNAAGIHAEQDSKNHSVKIKIEVNIRYNLPIPEKADEIQSKIVKDVTKITGLHVSFVHVVFKNIILEDPVEKSKEAPSKEDSPAVRLSKEIDDSFAED